MPNTNPETGIPYGVVNLHSLADWVFDEFFHSGTNETAEQALTEWKAENPEADDADEQAFWDSYECDEESYSLETQTTETGRPLKLGLSYLGGAPLVWVFESPVTKSVNAAFASCVFQFEPNQFPSPHKLSTLVTTARRPL